MDTKFGKEAKELDYCLVLDVNYSNRTAKNLIGRVYKGKAYTGASINGEKFIHKMFAECRINSTDVPQSTKEAIEEDIATHNKGYKRKDTDFSKDIEKRIRNIKEIDVFTALVYFWMEKYDKCRTVFDTDELLINKMICLCDYAEKNYPKLYKKMNTKLLRSKSLIKMEIDYLEKEKILVLINNSIRISKHTSVAIQNYFIKSKKKFKDLPFYDLFNNYLKYLREELDDKRKIL